MKIIRSTYFFAFMVYAGVTLFVAVALASYLPYSPISLSDGIKKRMQFFFPEGWAFFTRDPKEDNINLYRVVNNRVDLTPVNLKSGDVSLFFGASKHARMQMAEVGEIIEKIPDSLWVKNRGEYSNPCIKPTDLVIARHNISNYKSLQGKYIIEKIKPTPWAWSNEKNVHMPSQYIIVNVN